MNPRTLTFNYRPLWRRPGQEIDTREASTGTLKRRSDVTQRSPPSGGEYALIVVLVSIVCIVALSALGTQISTVFNTIKGNLAAT